ncbi:PPM-type phosphatase domain-containing protein [Entamoeba marina]
MSCSGHFKKAFKKKLKSLPQKKIVGIGDLINKCTQSNTNCNVIMNGYDTFAMTACSLYPVDKDNRKIGDPLNDRSAFLQFQNCYVGIVLDGCGWGNKPYRAAENAMNGIVTILVNSLNKCKTIREVGNVLVLASEKGHQSVIESENSTVSLGMTTVLINTSIKTNMNWYTISLSIGDSRAFKCTSTETEPLTGTFRLTNDTTNSRGAIGATNHEKQPDLKNVELLCHQIKCGETIAMMTDGFCDNLDSIICKVNKCSKLYANQILTQMYSNSTTLFDFVESLTTHIINLTTELRKFYVTLNRRISTHHPGKLDHASLLCYTISNSISHTPQPIREVKSDCFKKLQPINFSLNPHHSIQQRERSHSKVSIQIEITPPQKIPRKTFSGTTANEKAYPMLLCCPRKDRVVGTILSPRCNAKSPLCSSTSNSLKKTVCFSPSLSPIAFDETNKHEDDQLLETEEVNHPIQQEPQTTSGKRFVNFFFTNQ